MSALSSLYDTPRRETSPPEDADLAAALVQLERTQPRRGQLIVVSDFLDRTDWAKPLRRLALRHQVLAAQVTDRRELELPAVGMLSVVDAETGQRLHVQTNSETLACPVCRSGSGTTGSDPQVNCPRRRRSSRAVD